MIVFLSVLFEYIIIFLILSILIKKWCKILNEFLFVTFSSLTVSLLFPYIGIWVAGLIFMSLCSYLFKYKEYEPKKILFLSSLSMLIKILSDHTSSFILAHALAVDYTRETILLTHHLPIDMLISLTFAFIFIKFTQKVRSEINKNEHLLTGLTSLSLFMLGSFYGSIILGIYWGNAIELIILNLIFFCLYTILSIVSFFFLVKCLNSKYLAKKQKDEQEALKQYTMQIELQYSKMREFKHDYDNIMTSFVAFIAKEDFQGLKKYYSKNFDENLAKLLNHNFALQHLSRIEVAEIKSILAVKLMTAQEKKIEVKFEAVDKIDVIPMDSFILVRILGILLDNAIEELLEFQGGLLYVGVIKKGTTLTFAIQNTCRLNTPPVHKLKQRGFSTKGDNRGLGLSNVMEFVKQCPNMSIETNMNEQIFSQQIIIGG